MKTVDELRNELNELYGAIMALSVVMQTVHQQQQEKTKQMFEIKQLIRDLQELSDAQLQ